jgi:peptide/nickel transport system substrate-binding protein
MSKQLSARRNWRILGLAAGLAVAFVLSGCAAGGSTASDGDAEQVLTVSNPFPPMSLNPAQSGSGRAGTYLQPAYEPLVRTNADGSFEAALADEWELSDDNKSVTFSLREDARFSDGEVVNAEAAKKSIEYWLGDNGPFVSMLNGFESITVDGEFEFTISMSTPNPDLISMFNASVLAGNLISPKAIETPDILGTETFGAGPYVLDSDASVTGKSYTYLPNEHYYDQSRIHWDKIVIVAHEDSNSAIQSFQTGQVQFVVSDPVTGHSNSENLGDAGTIVASPLQWTGLFLLDREGTVSALGDVRVRQAINHAIDRPLVANALFGGLGSPTAQTQVEGNVGYSEASEDTYEYDIPRAKELLADAGYADGVTIKVGYVTNTLNTTIAQAIAAQLAEAGVSLEFAESRTLGEQAGRAAAGEFGAIIAQAGSGSPFTTANALLSPNGPFNNFKSTDPTLTALMTEAANLPVDAAAPVWDEVFKYVVDEAWFAPVAALSSTNFVSNDITTPEPGATTFIDLINIKPAD